MSERNKLKTHTLTLCECAMSIALAFALDMLCKLIPGPWINGGGISIGALPLVFISFRRGTPCGLLCGLAYSGIQMLTGLYLPGSSFISAFACIMLDYILAFTVLGAASFFAKMIRGNQLVGYALGTFIVYMLRFVCSFLSGAIIWAAYGTLWGIDNFWLYSFCYNISYMLPNAIIGSALIALICSRIDPKTLKKKVRSSN